ncbi:MULTISPECIES: NAD-dependent epimerase/dehydratase family protein [unclassified Nocardioides]|uniref:NAD-dependent epimerase/dehydratase family protein n=1 Tax=unclassified Nocardioides TaxID=2615069 RepID=UPI00360695C1
MAGATGWVGGAVVEAACARGIETIELAVRPAVSHVASMADLPALLDGPDVVVVNAVGQASGSPAELEIANLRICRELAEVCATHGARFLTIGSAAEVGAPLVDRVSESYVGRPLSDYGRSKLAATELVQDLRTDGLQGTVARVFNVVGPGRRTASPVAEFAARIRSLQTSGEVVEVRDATLVRDISGLAWVGDRLVDLAGIAGKVDLVNVCSGRPTSYRELIEAMAATRGLTVEVVNTQPGGVPRVVGDPALLLSLLPGTPVESLAEVAAQALEV